jgi:hypothetical protein
MLEPLARFGDSALFFLADLFVFEGAFNNLWERGSSMTSITWTTAAT